MDKTKRKSNVGHTRINEPQKRFIKRRDGVEDRLADALLPLAMKVSDIAKKYGYTVAFLRDGADDDLNILISYSRMIKSEWDE